ncbi:uncharacterized protein KIAA1755 homolog [Sceloporus undulatus]|uniref:uncharacterized protein KIAA1755 homolog n=1 Tax=Sceloporus undulatus TaxID=8520 RepID=UPI001C4CDCC7|nr:uncharacterized protein KIAA1755 homolog [Sceloporus undulatus]
MDPQSLDAAVQTTLLGLFPPFEATAPTVLSQLFRVLEARYHGDGLCCLLDFLIPSKRLLEHVRQAACAPYVSRVFLHEGWPLCLHEKVVVHLGPLNPLLLRPGDFYLQAEPCGEQSACLAVKCLSRDLTTVEKILVPEASCSLLFTKEWLEDINRDLDRPMLHTCLVATGNGIVPVAWNKIVTPEFVHLPKTEGLVEQKDYLEAYSFLKAGVDGSPRPSQGKYPGLIKVEQGTWKNSTLFTLPSLCDIISENLEGEYVNLLGFSEEKKPDSPSPAKSMAPLGHQQPSQGEESPRTEKGLVCMKGKNGFVEESWSCGTGPDSEEGPCTPCLRRKMNQDPKVHEPRCRYRESYVAALKNPVSFSSGLMEAILEEMDTAQHASESPDGKPTKGSEEIVSRISSEHPNKEGKAGEVSKRRPMKHLKSPMEGPAAGNKFSFLKGYRHPHPPPASICVVEKAKKGQEGPRKRTVCSPKAAQAKPANAGKGPSQFDAVFLEHPSSKSIDSNSASFSSIDAMLQELHLPGSSPWEPVSWESLHPELLSSGVVCLPGGTDKMGRPIIHITTSSREWHAPWCSAMELLRLLLYLCALSRKQSSSMGLTVVIDARKDTPQPSLSAALGATQKILPGSIHSVLLLAEKETASHLEKLPGVPVELLTSLKALTRFVDGSQLIHALDGQFPYSHGDWVQYFQKLHHFANDLAKASELLRSTIQELEKGDIPQTLQAVRQQKERHRQLMEEVLSDAQVVGLQRDGGATLARLRKEAARLSSSPAVWIGIDWALALYSAVEDQVHTLVTKSNSRLEHLEFLSKIRELEGEFSKVSLWFEEEGEPELHKVGSAEGSRETIEEAYRRFKDFFKEATVHYNHGLSLSKEAAKFQGSSSPEMEAFEVAKGAFQAKLTTFYMDMEMKGAELEILLDLHRFCDKVTQFNLDCKQRLALSASKGNDPKSKDAQRDAEDSLQRLSEEFSPEKFQQMKIQASSMCNGNGLAVWREALERCQEAKQILEDALVRFKEGRGDCGEKSGPFNPAPKGDNPDLGGASMETKTQGKLDEDKCKIEEDGSEDTPGVGDNVSVPAHDNIDKDVKGSEETYLDSLGTILECANPEAQDLDIEASESFCTPTPSLPSTPPDFSSHPTTKQMLGPCGNLPSNKQPSASMPSKGRSSRRKETAQYFQLSRHESFSSEDADSQNSAEDTLGSSTTTLFMDSPSSKASWTQERSLGILYLENHNANPLPNAATQ